MTIDAMTFDIGGFPSVRLSLASIDGLAPLSLPVSSGKTLDNFGPFMDKNDEHPVDISRGLVALSQAINAPVKESEDVGQCATAVASEVLCSIPCPLPVPENAPEPRTVAAGAIDKIVVKPRVVEPVRVAESTRVVGPRVVETPTIAAAPVRVEMPAVEPRVAVEPVADRPVPESRKVVEPERVADPVRVAESTRVVGPRVVEAPTIAAAPVRVEVPAVEPRVAVEPVADRPVPESRKVVEPVGVADPVRVVEPVADRPAAEPRVVVETVRVENRELPRAPQTALSTTLLSRPADNIARMDPAAEAETVVLHAMPVVDSAPPAVSPVVPESVQQMSAAMSRTAMAVETVNEIVETVVDKMAVSPTLAQGNGEIRIQLRPAVLDGSIVNISAKDGELTVVVTPATPEAAKAVAASLPQLEAALAAHAPAFHHVAVVLSAVKKGKVNEAA